MLCRGSLVQGLLWAGSWRALRACESVPEAHTSSLTSGNIFGVLTGDYKLQRGPLRCDLFIIKTVLLNACAESIHSVRSAALTSQAGPGHGLAATVGLVF